MSEKKEFKVGDDVWFILNTCIQKGCILNIYIPYNDNITRYNIKGGQMSASLYMMVERIFHTPKELLENMKQQIDELDK